MKITAKSCNLLEDTLDDEGIDFKQVDPDNLQFSVNDLPLSVNQVLQLVQYYIED